VAFPRNGERSDILRSCALIVDGHNRGIGMKSKGRRRDGGNQVESVNRHGNLPWMKTKLLGKEKIRGSGRPWCKVLSHEESFGRSIIPSLGL
jgi:hypothetical protein